MIFWCYQGVQKESTGMRWVKKTTCDFLIIYSIKEKEASGWGCYIEIEMFSILSLVGSRLDFVTQSRNETPGDNANE